MRQRARRLAGLVPALVLASALALPFVDQAWHIDDQIYLLGAEAIRRDPVRPLSLTTGFLGKSVPYHRGVNSHPQGLPFYLALWPAVQQRGGEVWAHLVMVPFLFVFIAATWFLAAAVGVDRRAVALLCAVAPPLVVCGHTVMTDVPFAALFWAGFVALWALLRSGGAWRLAWAVLLCTGAWMMQYRGLLLVPLGLVWVWLLYSQDNKNKIKTSGYALTLLALAAIPLGLVGWCVWNVWELGETHLGFSQGQIDYSVGRLQLSLTAMLSYLGGTLFPLVLLVPLGLGRASPSRLALGAPSSPVSRNGFPASRTWRAVWLAGGSALLGLLLAATLPAGVPGPRLWIGLCVGSGAFVLGGALLTGLAQRRRSPWLAPLAALLLALFAVQTVVSLFASVRLLLLLLPPLLVCLTSGLDLGTRTETRSPPMRASRRRAFKARIGRILDVFNRRATQRARTDRRPNGEVTSISILGRHRPLFALTLLLCGGLAALVSLADYHHAEAYRELAPRLAARVDRGGHFVGEWGLRAYLENEKFQYVTSDSTTPSAGETLVIPGLNCPWPLHPDLAARLGRPALLPLPGRFWLRTMDPGLGAGFYSDGYGLLPFAPSQRDRPHDTLKLHRVGSP